MTLSQLLQSLTGAERDFIASLNYGMDAEQHRSALDAVIATNGLIDFRSQGYWYPYEVIELGKNWLQDGHEREYAACLGIVLRNIECGADISNDLDWIVETQADSISKLPDELKLMVTDLSVLELVPRPARIAPRAAIGDRGRSHHFLAVAKDLNVAACHLVAE
jgi:hypothetical protein